MKPMEGAAIASCVSRSAVRSRYILRGAVGGVKSLEWWTNDQVTLECELPHTRLSSTTLTGAITCSHYLSKSTIAPSCH